MNVGPTFITMHCVAAMLMFAAPLAIEAQQAGKLYRIGVLEIADEAANTANPRRFPPSISPPSSDTSRGRTW